MLLVALLIPRQGDPADFEQRISIDARGASGKQLTDQLSQKTGIHFETRDEATMDRYIVHIENAPLKEALARIAEAETGEWLRLGAGSYRLRRSPEKVAAARLAAHEALVKKFKKAFEGYRKQLADRPDFSDEAAQKLAHDWRHLGAPPNNGFDNSGYWNRQNKLQQAVPIGRAFMRVIMAFSPEELATVPIERKTVFSTNPTAVQHALPDGAMDALNDLAREQIIWEDAVARYLPEQANMGWNGMATGGHIKNVTNAMITMTRWDVGSGIQAQLILSDAKSRIVTETYLSVDEPYEPEKPPATPATEKPPTPEPEVPLPPVDITLAKLFTYNAWDVRSRSPEASEEARAIAADPEKYDPLSTFVADGLIGIARQRKENLAAVIDERAIYAFGMSVSKKGMSPRALDTLRNWGQQNVSEGNGWLVVRVKEPDRADEVRCDRHAMKLMLDAARSQGRLSLDDAAAYALTSERFNENPIPQAYLTILLDKQGPRTLQENDKNLLRFYGSLDAAERNNAEHLSLSRLSAFQMDLLEKMVYGNYANLQEDGQQMEQDEDGQYYGMWNTTSREPTVSLGNGIPRNGFVKISLAKNRAILAHMQYGEWDQGFQTYDPSSLAWMIASRETQSEDNFGWNVLGMRAADRTQVTFDFKYTNKLSQTLTLQDVLPTTKETAFIEKLPDDVRKDLQKAIDEAKKQYAQGNGMRYYGGFGGASAPP